MTRIYTWLIALVVCAAAPAAAQTTPPPPAPPPAAPVPATDPDFPRGRVSGLIFGDFYYNVTGDPAHGYSATGTDSARANIDFDLAVPAGAATLTNRPRFL